MQSSVRRQPEKTNDGTYGSLSLNAEVLRQCSNFGTIAVVPKFELCRILIIQTFDNVLILFFCLLFLENQSQKILLLHTMLTQLSPLWLTFQFSKTTTKTAKITTLTAGANLKNSLQVLTYATVFNQVINNNSCI